MSIINFDELTGELPKRKSPYPRERSMMFHNEIKKIIKDKDITAGAKLLFWYLCTEVGLNNKLNINLYEVADEVSMNYKTVCDLLKKLKKRGYIVNGKYPGQLAIPPNYVWRGYPDNYENNISDG